MGGVAPTGSRPLRRPGPVPRFACRRVREGLVAQRQGDSPLAHKILRAERSNCRIVSHSVMGRLVIAQSGKREFFFDPLVWQSCRWPVKTVPSEAPPTPDDPTIPRSAASQAKGRRLQKLRCCLLLLRELAADSKAHIYCAIEVEGDVFISCGTPARSESLSEEDKNFAAGTALTFAASAVLNSMVIFADQWITRKYSKRYRFTFYSTSHVGREKKSDRVKALAITLPVAPMLKLLSEHDYSDPQLIPCVKALVLDEYTRQYAGKALAGHLGIISGWDDEQWRKFLARIRWLLEEADEAETEKLVHAAVKGCPFFNERHEGRESLIAGAILELLEQREQMHEYADRFVYGADVECIFKRVESGEIRPIDPAWNAWKEIARPTDTRNIGDKLRAVCPTLSTRTLGRYQRRTSIGLDGLQAHGQDKNVVAMRYHIFDACEEELDRLAVEALSMSESELSARLQSLVDIAVSRVEEQAREYGYTHKTRAFIEGIVLELFDSCFLAFDGDRS